jgi:acetolactate decarboxylase
MKRLITILALLVFCMSISGCNVQESQHTSDRELLYQVSTINALLEGSYDGQVSIKELKNYGDIGIGTFAKLDGEMIVLDGEVYRAKSDGTVEKVDDNQSTPFASVTYFNEDQKIENVEFTDYKSLQKILDTEIENRNLFYTFKVSGEFSYVKVRSVPPQQKPYLPLEEVTKNQPTFEYENVRGTLLGFWCPTYVDGINVPGYHLHFISEDKTMGGHLLEVKCKNGTILADQTPSFQMTLPENSDFGKLDLEKDKTEELEHVEK